MVVWSRLALWQCLERAPDLNRTLQRQRESVIDLGHVACEDTLHVSGPVAKNDENESLLTSQSMHPALDLDLLVSVGDALADLDLQCEVTGGCGGQTQCDSSISAPAHLLIALCRLCEDNLLALLQPLLFASLVCLCFARLLRLLLLLLERSLVRLLYLFRSTGRNRRIAIGVGVLCCLLASLLDHERSFGALCQHCTQRGRERLGLTSIARIV